MKIFKLCVVPIVALVLIFAGAVFSEKPGDVTNGKKVYESKCSACHEVSIQGPKKVRIAPDIKNPFFLGMADDVFITNTIVKGRKGTAMSPFPMGIKTEEIPDVIAYLRSLPVSDPIRNKIAKIKIDHTRKISGSSSEGNKKFEQYCQGCHGEKGKGIMGSGPGIGTPGFLETASDDFIFQTVKNGRMGTAMRSFGTSSGLANLKDEDIMDIISYLKSLKK